MMSTSTRLLTYDELRALPDLGPFYELIDGVLIVPPSPFALHGLLFQRLFGIIWNYLVPLRLADYLLAAPCDVRLGERLVVQPDIFCIAPGGPAVFSAGVVAGPPTLIVEILSPSNRRHDLVTKFEIYERAGVAEYWIADARNATLTVYLLVNGRYVEQVHDGITARSVVLPGLTVDIPALFGNVPQGIGE
jgi:Uma2 family endonuclease